MAMFRPNPFKYKAEEAERKSNGYAMEYIKKFKEKITEDFLNFKTNIEASFLNFKTNIEKAFSDFKAYVEAEFAQLKDEVEDDISDINSDCQRANATVDLLSADFKSFEEEVSITFQEKADKTDTYTKDEVINQIKNIYIPDVDQTFNHRSENAQSGKAVAEAVSELEDFIVNVTIDENMQPVEKDKSYAEILQAYQDGKRIYASVIVQGIELTRIPMTLYDFINGDLYFCTITGREDETGHIIDELHIDYNNRMFTSQDTAVTTNSMIDILNDESPSDRVPSAYAVVHYVKDKISTKADKPSFATFTDGETIVLSDNVRYIASGEISTLTIEYPDTDFLCSLEFTTSAEGDITIILPQSKYIGKAPVFGNDEAWEISIKNGIVVGGMAE